MALAKQAQDDVLALLGGDGQKLAIVANARHVELEFVGDFKAVVELARVPWEALLALGTERERLDRPLTVTRCWCPPNAERAGRPTPLSELLVASCSPGALSEKFEFDIEEQMVLGTDGGKQIRLRNPGVSELRRQLQDHRPHAVHLTGFDPHQARAEGAILQPVKPAAEEEPAAEEASAADEGFVLRGEPGSWDEGLLVSPSELAEYVEPSGADLVTCNFYYSAQRVCLAMLREGVPYAVGLHDEIDDAAAETFFGEFYRTWRGTGLENDRVHLAFVDACERFKAALAERMVGSAIVLWTTRPALHDAQQVALRPEGGAREAPASRSAGRPTVNVLHRERLIYAMLHNGISPFSQFRILLPDPDTECAGTVEISLHDGAPGRSYTASFRATSAVLDLRNDVRAPLDPRLFLSSSRWEETRALMLVRVCVDGRDLLHRSFPVTLAPVNEWYYAGEWTGALLPSFVLPFDPVIPQVVAAALPALRALTDNARAGFQGYPGASADKGASADEGAQAEHQARALWHTLISQYALNYITAPPSQKRAHLLRQRIRIPSTVVSGRQGTCIDLALLFAALLEHVGLYPVLVLTEDHALVGYWKDAAAHKSFLNVTLEDDEVDEGNAAQLHAWEVCGRYLEIMRRNERGDLVLLEATGIAAQMSFGDAKWAGRGALAADPKKFEGLLDVRRARDWGISPLPIVFDDAK
jgi:hypothetical protein